MSTPPRGDTTRRWMAFIVIVACIVAAVLAPSRARLRQRFDSHATWEAFYAQRVRDCLKQAEDLRKTDPVSAARLVESAGLYRQQAEHHARMRAKYEGAAHSPWTPVMPDPPAPSDAKMLLAPKPPEDK